MGLLSWLLGRWRKPEPKPPVPPDPSGDWSVRLLHLHNKERYSPLLIDVSLATAAKKYAGVMAGYDTLDHSVDGSLFYDRIKKEGFSGSYISENIAYTWDDNPDNVFRNWMSSYGHRSNIESSKFKYVGFGRALSRSGKWYWCVNFGS